ncbi:MAG: hypothetical protein ACKOFW_01940 [Planctomycetaceae bacterium]
MAIEYQIRSRFLNLLHHDYRVFDQQEALIGFIRHKAFKLKEDIRVYTDETLSEERLSIKARQIIDISATYDVTESRSGKSLGILQRKGLASLLRDTWVVTSAEGLPAGRIEEDSLGLALLRRFINIIPQAFRLVDENEVVVATFRQNWNFFVPKLSITVNDNCRLPPVLVLAAGVVLIVIEGRQKS